MRHAALTLGIAILTCNSLPADEGTDRQNRWAKALMKAQDANADGVISQNEAKDRVKQNFERLDQDNSGSIEHAELVEALNRRNATRSGDRNEPRERLDVRRLPTPDNVILKLDIAYRDEHKRQKLDLMLPKEEATEHRPAIVFIHGGGWRSGDKASGMWRSLPMQFASQGYVCASVNYRLTGDGVDVFGCIEDCRCAVRWLRANAEKYNIDPKRIGAYGNSAGAHLVSLLGLTPDEKRLDGDAPYADFSSGFQAVCSAATPANFMDFGKPTRANFDSLFGSDPEDGKKKASPVSWATKDAPPFLLIHGTSDRTVPVKNGDDLNKALENAGADVTYIRVAGAGHGVFGERSRETMPATEKFFARVLKGED